MPKLSEVKEETGRFFGLFIGASGSGKSCAAFSFIKKYIDEANGKPKKKIKVFDIDQRIRGMLGATWLSEYTEYVNFTQYSPFDGFSSIEKELDVIALQAKMHQSEYGLIVMDSLTSQTHMLLNEGIKLLDASAQQSKEKGHRIIGSVKMAGPADYGYEAKATYDIFDYLRSLPLDVIVSAHVVPQWGREDPDNPYSPTIEVGEQLSVRNKIGVNIQIYFDEVYRFSKTGSQSFDVQFRTDIAKTAHRNLTAGNHNITGVSFYDYWLKLLKGEKK